MDVRELKQLLSTAATGSLILIGADGVLAGNHAHEQPTRPHMSAECLPNWGFNQTCWTRFPPVPDCPGNCPDSFQGDYGSEPGQQMIYAPQNSLVLPNSQIMVPEYRGIQAPVNVFPDSSTGRSGGPTTGVPPMPSPGMMQPSSSVPYQLIPTQPHGEPGAPNALPSIPAPPTLAPGQSSLNHSFRSSAAGQMQTVFSPSPAVHQGKNSTRYGHRDVNRSPIASGSHRNIMVANSRILPGTDLPPRPQQSPQASSVGSRYGLSSQPQSQQMPAIPQNPMRNASMSRTASGQSTASVSYRSASSMPPISAISQSQIPNTQLAPMPNYSTIPSEPLRSTP